MTTIGTNLNSNIFIKKTDQIKSTSTINSLSKPSFKQKNDEFTLTSKSEIRKNFEVIKSQQGFIGKAWDGFKNIFGMKSGSKHVEEIIKQAEKGQISKEEATEAIKKYEEGQKTCVDVVADLASGILAVGAFVLAVPTGGASLAVGLGLSTAVGAGIKIGIKAGDAVATGKEYKGKDLLYDTATGGINGLLAPVTNGLGNTVTKTIGKKLGLKIVQEGAEEVAEQAVKQGIKQTAKNIVLNQSIDVVGGTIGNRALALGTGMAIDGALGGASDNMIRASLNGENVLKAGVQGAIGGAIMAPVIGGGFRVAGKAGKALNNKITTKIVLPDGVNTKFKQGQIGDCALLSTIDGMMNNPTTAKTFKKSITKTLGGDYNVKIGDQIVRVSKASLSDEMLSDKTGIKIFEQAYKQLTGDIDGGFAEVVAKQFGLNPVHIANESITDELLDNLAKHQNDTVLSFGTLVDTDGAISTNGGQRHYFTIKKIDAEGKTVTLTSPIDTSKTMELSYDDVKSLGISIDGGSVKEIELPNITRNADEMKFKAASSVSVAEEISEAKATEEEELINVLTAILHKKTTVSQQDFCLSDDVIRRATDIIAQSGTDEHAILTRLAKECYVSVKTPDDIKRLLVNQYATLPQKGDTTIILNPSRINDGNKTIGSSNEYISQWCAEALSLDKTAIFSRRRIKALQKLIDDSVGKRITIMVPDDFAGSGRSLAINTIEVISKLNIPDDVKIDVVLAPSSATTSAKKVFRYISKGELRKLEKSGVLSQGGTIPDSVLLQNFFKTKGENVQIISSDRILTVPTIQETSTYKALSPAERQAVDVLLTTDSCFRFDNTPSRTGLTGYGRDGHGLNCTMASFPSNTIDPETGLYIRKSPNNNLAGAMPFSIADGVERTKIKMPGTNTKEDVWTKQKDRIFEILTKKNG